MLGAEIPLINEFKYLGFTLDPLLNWNTHMESRIRKACMTFGQCRAAIGRTYGLSPKSTLDVTKIVLPTLINGAVVCGKLLKSKLPFQN
jgi:hypothetical protein